MKPIFTRGSLIFASIVPAGAGVLSALPLLATNPALLVPVERLTALLTPYLAVAKVGFLGVTIENPPAVILILSLIVLLVATLLLIAQDGIGRLFTGELIANTVFGRWLTRLAQRRFYHLQEAYGQALALRETGAYEEKIPAETHRRILEAKADYLQRQLMKYPVHADEIAPTRFGNTFAATYSRIAGRYGMNLTLVWNRLLHLAPQEYRKRVDSAQIATQAYMNSSLVYLCLALVAILVAVWGMNTLSAFAWCLVYWLISLFLYQASVRSAVVYNSLIEEGLDLYRFEVREKMHLREPKSYNDEQRLWGEVSRFILRGTRFDAGDILDYALAEDSPRAVIAEESAENAVQEVKVYHLAPEFAGVSRFIGLACIIAATAVLLRTLVSLWTAYQGKADRDGSLR